MASVSNVREEEREEVDPLFDPIDQPNLEGLDEGYSEEEEDFYDSDFGDWHPYEKPEQLGEPGEFGEVEDLSDASGGEKSERRPASGPLFAEAVISDRLRELRDFAETKEFEKLTERRPLAEVVRRMAKIFEQAGWDERDLYDIRWKLQHVAFFSPHFVDLLIELHLSIADIFLLSPLFDDETMLAALIWALKNFIAVEFDISSSVLEYCPSLQRMARHITKPEQRKWHYHGFREQDTDLDKIEGFLRGYAERNGAERLFSAFAGSELGRRIQPGWLEEVVEQPAPPWISRVFQLLSSALLTLPDPEAALKLQQDELLAPLANAIVGDVGLKTLIRNVRDPEIVMRLYDAFPSLRWEIQKLPMSPRSLLRSGRYHLMEQEFRTIKFDPSGSWSSLVLLAAGESPLYVTQKLAEWFWKRLPLPLIWQQQVIFALSLAAKNNRLDVFEWLKPEIIKFVGNFMMGDIYREAARKGNFAVLLWLASNAPDCGGHIFASIFEGLGEYVSKRVMLPSGLPGDRLAEDRVVAVVRWFGDFFGGAGSYLLKPGNTSYTVGKKILFDACRTGSLRYVHALLKYFDLGRAIQKSDSQGLSLLADVVMGQPSFDLTKWVGSHFGLSFVEGDWFKSFEQACKNGWLERARQISEMLPIHFGIQKSVNYAVFEGHLDVVDWLFREFGATPRLEDADFFWVGIPGLRRLVEYGVAIPESVVVDRLRRAARNDDVPMLNFIFRELKFCPTTKSLIDQALGVTLPENVYITGEPISLSAILAISEALDLRREDLDPPFLQRIANIFTEKERSVDYRNLGIVNRFVDRFNLARGFFTDEEVRRMGCSLEFSSEIAGGYDARSDVVLWRYLTFGVR